MEASGMIKLEAIDGRQRVTGLGVQPVFVAHRGSSL